jgi:hypothetical protein
MECNEILTGTLLSLFGGSFIMVNLNFQKEIDRAEKCLKEKNYADAVNICSPIVEVALKNLYFEIRRKANKNTLFEIEEIEYQQEKRNKSKIEKFTFGQILHLFSKTNINYFELAEELLGKQVSITNSIDFDRLTAVRNNCVHPKACSVDSLEVKYFISQVKLIMEGLGYYLESEQKQDRCPDCGEKISEGWNSCPFCAKALKVVCPECGFQVEKDFHNCPNCHELLNILSEKDLDTFKNIKSYLSKVFSDPKPCPICQVKAAEADVDYDEKKKNVTTTYGFYCDCEKKIERILKTGCLPRSDEFRLQRHYVENK